MKPTYFGGNPDRKPQESRGQTYGLVLDAPGIRGLSLTADLWRIRRRNLLGQRSVAQIDASDAALLREFTRRQTAAAVPADQIDIGSGPTYAGDPDMECFPLTPEDRATFAAYNAANPNNPAAPAGRIFARYRPFLNIASSEHAGIDFGLRSAMPRQPWGRVVIASDWAYLKRARNLLAPANLPPIETNELYADGAARWRSATTINIEHGGWDFGLGIHHVGKTHDAGATTTQAVFESLGRPSCIEPFETGGRTIHRLVIPPTTSFNLSLTHAFGEAAGWLRGTRVRLGINNVTNEEPPLSSGAFGHDAAVSQMLLAGRTFSLEVARRF